MESQVRHNLVTKPTYFIAEKCGVQGIKQGKAPMLLKLKGRIESLAVEAER